MAISCDPNDLMQASACYKCIAPGMQPEVIIYLLAQLLNATNGASTDPQVLMQEAQCMRCIPAGMQEEVMTYLLCQLANAVGA